MLNAPAASAATHGTTAMPEPTELPHWQRREDAGFSTLRLGRLHDAMQGLVDAGRAPGVATLVARHGRIVDIAAHGLADPQAGVPMAADTICRWYSLTKSVTGMAMMLLFEEGAWRFEDPVSEWLPEVAGMQVFRGLGAIGDPELEALSRPILMRDLLGHRAGFAYGLQAGPHEVDRLYAEQHVMSFDHGIRRLVERACALPLVAQPGTRFHYSVSQDLCGAIIERISGATLCEFMRTRLFEPLGMRDTGFHVPPDRVHRLAALSQHDADGMATPAAEGLLNWEVATAPALESGGGGLVGTLLDAWRFAEFVAGRGDPHGDPLMAPSTRRIAATALHHDVPTGFGSETGIGYTAGGFYRMGASEQMGSPTGAGTLHSAGAGGCWMNIDPQTGVVVVGMTSLLGWNHGAPPAYRAEGLVYQALTEP